VGWKEIYHQRERENHILRTVFYFRIRLRQNGLFECRVTADDQKRESADFLASSFCDSRQMIEDISGWLDGKFGPGFTEIQSLDRAQLLRIDGLTIEMCFVGFNYVHGESDACRERLIRGYPPSAPHVHSNVKVGAHTLEQTTARNITKINESI
jgi:hypothetical protein